MPGGYRCYVVVQQFSQGRNVSLHTASGGHNDNRGAIHDVVTCKYQALFLKQVTKMIVDMPGRSNRAQCPAITFDQVPITEINVRFKR